VIEKLLAAAAVPLVILIAFALASLWTEQRKTRYRFLTNAERRRREVEANEMMRRERDKRS
jgi:hypothetical protein